MNRLALGAAMILAAWPVGAQDAAAPEPLAPNQYRLNDPPPGPSAGEQPMIEPLGEERFRIGALTLDRARREIRLPGAVAINRGTLEYLACAPAGKLYESVLRADVDPYHLYVALLLIGLVPENNLDVQGDEKTPRGDRVEISVSWDHDGTRRSMRAEELLFEPYLEKPMDPTAFVFTGSFFRDGVFAASVDRSLVAVYNDPTAILNNPLPTGRNDEAYIARTDVLPPQGTPVEILLRAVKKADS